MKSRLFIILLLLTPFLDSNAQDSLLTELLKPHAYQLQLKAGKLSGPGAGFLQQEGAKAQFLLIGEDHGIAELPMFTAALFQDLKPRGYQYFATETGPFTAAFLEKTVRQKDWRAQLDAFFKELPWSIPFYSLKEECEILETVLTDSPQGQPLIWGLDQEFAAAPRMIFKKLQVEAQTEESKKLAGEYFDMANNGFKEATKNKNPGASFMAIVKPDDFKKLKSAFKDQAEALKLITALEESIGIYQLWFAQQGYESNRQRAEMMKRYFWEYYQNAKKNTPTPKVVFKFGANHMYRGANALNVFDIGNFVSELASQEGTESFHLYVLGQEGTQNRYTPFSPEEDKAKSVEPSAYFEAIDFGQFPADNWTVFDLRPLRHELFKKRLQNLPEKLEKLIWSYDALLVMPQVHASTFWE